jgi:molecular chaperone GrpE (heat shock protein)
MADPNLSSAPETLSVGSDVTPAEESPAAGTAAEASAPAERRDLAVPAPLAEAASLLEIVERGFDRLARAFDDKLAYDAHKESQIDALHRELQEHRGGLLARAVRPLLAGLIRLHDDLGRAAEVVVEADLDVVRRLQEFQDDVEILLGDYGVTVFREPVERFEPRRQTVRRTIDADPPECAGAIACRVRPGFERDGELLQKERVDVYVAAREPAGEPGAARARPSAF